MPPIAPCGYRRVMSIRNLNPSIVVFSDFDYVLRDPHAAPFAKAGRVLEQLEHDDAALVLCSGNTRAELELARERLGNTAPFICEHGGAVFIPAGYFDFDVPSVRDLAGYHAVEFGRPYADVVEILHRTARRLRIGIAGFSDLSTEEVARACRMSLLQARLAKLRDYEESFRILDGSASARARLFKALGTAGLRCTRGQPFDRVGAPVDHRVGVNLLNGLYRRTGRGVITIGVTHSAQDDNLLGLVDHAIMAPDDDSDSGAIDVVDWAEAIVDAVRHLRCNGAAVATVIGVDAG